MRRYKVTVSYRPHVSSLRRETVEFTIEAPNKQVALVRAGWMMHVQEVFHIAGSLSVEIEVMS